VNQLTQDSLDLVAVLWVIGVLLIAGGAAVWLGGKLADIGANFLDRPRTRNRK